MAAFLIVLGLVAVSFLYFVPGVIPWFFTVSENRLGRFAQSTCRLTAIILLAAGAWHGHLNRAFAVIMCVIIGLITIFAWLMADTRDSIKESENKKSPGG